MTFTVLILCLVTVVCWGGAPVFDKFSLRFLTPDQLFIARFYVFTILLLAPMVLQFDEIRQAVVRAGDRRLVWAILGSTSVPLVGMFLYYRALSAAEASKVVPLCATYPLMTALLAWGLLREPFTPSKVAGTCFVVAGAFLLARP